MSKKNDDLEAVRVIADALEPFDDVVRERILKWACERVGMHPKEIKIIHETQTAYSEDGGGGKSPAEKAARTRKANAEKRSEAARKANKTRGKKGRSEAAKKAAATRRACQAA